MRLGRLGKYTWDVLCAADQRGNCQVLDFLLELSGDYRPLARDMLALLREHVPVNGPPRSMPQSRSLGDGFHEFRKNRRRGKHLRVIYFFNRDRVVVCTSAFLKDDETPESELSRARRLRREYLEAQQRQALDIFELPRWTTR